jgi:hypothetical protein
MAWAESEGEVGEGDVYGHLMEGDKRGGLGDIGSIPGPALIFVSAQLKTALSGIWEPLLGFSEQSLFPDIDGFALAHSVDKPFPAEFTGSG